MSRAWWMVAAMGCGHPPDLTDPALLALRAPPDGSVRYGAFAGHTPCGSCDRLKIAVFLNQAADDDAPTTYVMEREFVGVGDTRFVSVGTWSWTPGPAWWPDGDVATLIDGGLLDPADIPDASAATATPRDFTAWLVLQDDVLVLLDDDGDPRVGDAAESYALSRTDLE